MAHSVRKVHNADPIAHTDKVTAIQQIAMHNTSIVQSGGCENGLGAERDVKSSTMLSRKGLLVLRHRKLFGAGAQLEDDATYFETMHFSPEETIIVGHNHATKGRELFLVKIRFLLQELDFLAVSDFQNYRLTAGFTPHTDVSEEGTAFQMPCDLRLLVYLGQVPGPETIATRTVLCDDVKSSHGEVKVDRRVAVVGELDEIERVIYFRTMVLGSWHCGSLVGSNWMMPHTSETQTISV